LAGDIPRRRAGVYILKACVGRLSNHSVAGLNRTNSSSDEHGYGKNILFLNSGHQYLHYLF